MSDLSDAYLALHAARMFPAVSVGEVTDAEHFEQFLDLEPVDRDLGALPPQQVDDVKSVACGHRPSDVLTVGATVFDPFG